MYVTSDSYVCLFVFFVLVANCYYCYFEVAMEQAVGVSHRCYSHTRLVPSQQCYDDADYTNVNQCMKFMAKTEMNTATFRDITLATSQGTLVDRPLSGYRVSKKFRSDVFGTYFYLLISTSLLIYGIIKFRRIRKEVNFAPNWDPKQPLVFA